MASLTALLKTTVKPMTALIKKCGQIAKPITITTKRTKKP